MDRPRTSPASPYREPAPPDPKDRARDERGDEDLVLPFFVLWALGVLVVGSALASREAWGAGATLAGMGVVLLPWLLRRTFARRLSRAWRR